VQVTVNGEYRDVADRTNVADLVAGLNGTADLKGGAPSGSETCNKVPLLPRGIAVAVNGDVVPRSMWDVQNLNDGDAVEILTAVQGG
jgi:sulfur carrier protein